MRADDRSTERGTVSWLVRRYVESRTDITEKAQQQYAWAIPHIENGLGAIPLATLVRKGPYRTRDMGPSHESDVLGPAPCFDYRVVDGMSELAYS